MAFMITDDCISCDACVAECPNSAISEDEDQYVIDPERCTECAGHYDEPQCVEVCPVDCCVRDPNYQEEEEQLLAKADQIRSR